MKIALITDTHWGIRNDSQVMLDNMKRFLDEVFFPTIEREHIQHVVHLGDLLDRRKYVNIATANRLRVDFIDPIFEKNLEMHHILGNHDVYYKNTNSVNGVHELLGTFANIHIYDKAEEVTVGDTKILFIPWINSENREHTLELIGKSNAQIVMGHLELNGYEMHRGHLSDHGDDPKLFDRYDCVFSGHYHTKSSSGNITYLGSPCQYTWSDFGDDRGFHIFDTDTRELSFYGNPHSSFRKIFYDDSKKEFEEISSFEAEPYAGCYVKLIVQNKTNPYWFDMVVDKLEKIGVADLQVVEDHMNLDVIDDTDIVNEAEDTMTILKKYVDGMVINDKKRVDNIITSLYNEAQSIE
jgi:DNA repair exonuclease SbcCD nuclease subunit